MVRRIVYNGPILVEIHDEVLFLPTGSVGRWKASVRRQSEILTRMKTPVNKRSWKWPNQPARGTLQQSIASRTTGGLAAKRFSIITSANAPYALYVHEGTKTPIFAKNRSAGGQFGTAETGMALPPNNFGRFRRRQRVRGQDANPFLIEGMKSVSAVHPAVQPPTAGGLRTFR
jgi:hypothetical protein